MAIELGEAATGASRFEAQNLAHNTASEDLFKSQTVGLVNLSDFRKRRAEALEVKERELLDGSAHGSSAATPRDGSSAPELAKKRKKVPRKAKVSFALEEEEASLDESSASSMSHGGAPQSEPEKAGPNDRTPNDHMNSRHLGPNAALSSAPQVMTKSALSKAAQKKEQIREEFLLLQEIIKSTEILVPFVFYDGTDVPGGTCRMLKGDPMWLFLDRARKVGADSKRKEWARVSVDDLTLVKNDVIIPHHYDFYYFIMNDVKGPRGLLFDYSKRPPDPVVSGSTDSNYEARQPQATAGVERGLHKHSAAPMEGSAHDPASTKIVDRRWYEAHKHIYPASIWRVFDPAIDYEAGVLKDRDGNSFFFS